MILGFRFQYFLGIYVTNTLIRNVPAITGFYIFDFMEKVKVVLKIIVFTSLILAMCFSL